MLTQLMKNAIDDFTSDTLKTCSVFTMAEAGKLSPRDVTLYIKNAEFIVKNTLSSLAVARKAALSRNLPHLVKFYERKMREEDGHEVWAENDLETLRRSFGVKEDLAVSPWVERIIRFNKESIMADPHLYLSWQLFAEYFTVLAGPTWLAAVKDKCGVPPEMLSVIANHAELDKDHVDYALHEFDSLTAGGIAPWRMMECLYTGMSLYRSFCDGLANEFDQNRSKAAA